MHVICKAEGKQKKVICNQNFDRMLYMQLVCSSVYRKWVKLDCYIEVNQMRTKPGYILFLNAPQLGELELSYLNSMNVLYTDQLSSKMKVVALKFSEHLKKQMQFAFSL